MDESLSDRFPAIFSHCVKKDDTVQQAITSNLSAAFVPRQSAQAASQLQEIRNIIQDTALSSEPDQRLSPFDCGQGKLDYSSIYKLLKAKGRSADPSSEFI